VLPIASSIPYAVTDSLGNLICPRDPNRKILGYRQITADVTLTGPTSATQVTGLSVPVIIPTGRKVKITGTSRYFFGTAATNSIASIWDGTVNSGTKLQEAYIGPAAGATAALNSSVVLTPATSTKTYNLGLQASSGNVTIGGSSTTPGSITVELA
jgi:hypothetical protein